MTEKLILASGSPFRKAMLENAGVPVDAIPADLDERALEAPLAESGATPEEVALVLAEAKAVAVSEEHPGRLVLGCDQTLSLGDEVFHKPDDMEGARAIYSSCPARPISSTAPWCWCATAKPCGVTWRLPR